jgi:hypothetical protein
MKTVEDAVRKYCHEVIRNLEGYYDYPDAREDNLGSGNADDIYEYGHTLGMIEGLKRVLEYLDSRK